MKLYNKVLFGAALLMGAFLTACDDNDWEPGAQDTDTGVSAYFKLPADTNYIFDATTDNSTWEIPVTIYRQVTDRAVKVPLSFHSSIEGIACPNEVTFEDGASKAVINVTCHDVPIAVTGVFTITIDPSQTDIYGIGQNAITLSMIASEWKLISEKVTYYYWGNMSGTEKIYPNTYGEMYHLEGTNRFQFTDFYGSGLSINFDAKASSGSQRLDVLNNCQYLKQWPEEEDEYDCWYLYDDEAKEYPTFVPGDDPNGKEIEYLEFYTIDYSNNYLYSYVNMIYNTTTLYGYGGTTVAIDFTDGSFQWGYWQMDWKLLYNPFENE